jgi:hypothetical protein
LIDKTDGGIAIDEELDGKSQITKEYVKVISKLMDLEQKSILN